MKLSAFSWIFIPFPGSSYCSTGAYFRGHHHVRRCIEGKAWRARRRRTLRPLDWPRRLRQRSQKVSNSENNPSAKILIWTSLFQDLIGWSWHHLGLLVRRWLQPRLRIAQANGQVHPLRIIERCHWRNQELLQRCSLGKIIHKLVTKGSLTFVWF